MVAIMTIHMFCMITPPTDTLHSTIHMIMVSMAAAPTIMIRMQMPKSNIVIPRLITIITLNTIQMQ